MSTSPLKENDIRPREITDRYLELSLKDAQKMNPAEFVEVPCPGCSSQHQSPKFLKNNFHFVICKDCGSLFCSPRPSQKMLNEFYEKGESSNYWANVFFPAVAESRREKLFRKKAHQISILFPETFRASPITICDVGAGYGIFLEELYSFFLKAKLCAIEPGQALAKKCRVKGFETLETTAEKAESWANRFDLVISSEVLEHIYQPDQFTEALYRLVKPGGTVIVTGLGYEGFDILLLQEKSKSVFPPHHINFLSLQGCKKLFERTGFKKVEVWTPGELDVDIVMNSEFAPEFLKTLCKREGAGSALQDLLKKYGRHIYELLL